MDSFLNVLKRVFSETPTPPSPFGVCDMRSFESPGEHAQYPHLLSPASDLFIQLTPSPENRFHTQEIKQI